MRTKHRILGCVDTLNKHLQLGLTWHDVVHMYEFHSQANGGFYLKSRLSVVRLISCLPKSNKGMKDDSLRAMARWSSLSNPRERGRWDTLESGSLAKHFKSFNLHSVVIILYFALFR